MHIRYMRLAKCVGWEGERERERMCDEIGYVVASQCVSVSVWIENTHHDYTYTQLNKDGERTHALTQTHTISRKETQQ